LPRINFNESAKQLKAVIQQVHKEKQVDDFALDKNIQLIDKRLKWIENNVEKIGNWLNQQ
jgi:hypothetical protein